jgi:hypothetical protein
VSDDWWIERRQDRQIKDLQGEVEAAYDYAAKRSRVLQSRLADVQGTIERRLNRMARSFDAFVELSDLRLELAVFDREAAVRHRTRRLLMGLAQGLADPPPLDLDDCPGYWLKPAAEALAALVRGDAAAEKFGAEAVARDEGRTTLFLTLGLATAGRYAEAVPWLARALPSLGGTVTAVQRQLWIACADGAFGDPGCEHVQLRLTELLDEMPQDVAEAQLSQWRNAVSGRGEKRPSPLPRELQNEKALTEPLRQAERLRALRSLVEEALRPFDAAPASDFGSLLTTLVDEGSPDERDLVARARELREIIETGGAERPPAWDAPAGNTLDLLRGDLFERTAPGPRALAARVGGSRLRQIAEDLARRATVRPPDDLDVRLSGRPIRVGTAGAPALAEAQARIDQEHAVSPTGERVGMGVGLAGVVVLVLTITAGVPVLAVLAVLMTIVGASIWGRTLADRRRARKQAEHDKERLARETKAIADALKECHNHHKQLVESVAADREAILTVLA